MLNHTLKRLARFIIIPSSIKKMQLISKWDCDGSSGHSEYMQKPSNSKETTFYDSDDESQNYHNRNKDSEGIFSDSNLFFISFVPLLVGYSDDDDNEPIIIWQNSRPSSTY